MNNSRFNMARRMMSARFVAGLLLGFSSSEMIFAQNPHEAHNVELSGKIVEAYAEKLGFSGNVLIGQGDSIIYHSTNGHANYEHDVPNTLNTKFRLASLSKQFTAAALLIMQQQGKLEFDVPVSMYLDDLKPEIADKITIHHMLSHSSGLSRDIESLADKDLGQSFISLSEIIGLINGSELQFEPGERWAYSNLGYAVAAAIIEKVTGTSYGKAMDSLLFKPLGMNGTAHETSSNIIANKADGYVSLPTGNIRASYEDKSYVIGAGSIYSTTNDLFIWTREIMTESLFNEESRKKLFSRQAGRYSYGWFIDTYVWPPVNDENQAVNPHHEGGSPGFESKVSILTEHDLVVIILSNKLPSGLSGLANKITNVSVGFEESIPEQNADNRFYSKLFSEGIDAAVSMAEDWKALEKSHLIPASSDVLLVGRGYMGAQEYKKAMLIMDYLIASSPKWSYPFLFKGIILEQQNRIDEAVQWYEKTLDVDPKQSNAINHLKKLARSSDSDYSVDLDEFPIFLVVLAALSMGVTVVVIIRIGFNLIRK